MNVLRSISGQTPLKSRWTSLLASGAYLAAFNPYASAGTRMLDDIEHFALWAPYYPELLRAAEWSLFAASGLCVPYMAAKLLYPGAGKVNRRGQTVVVGDMEFDERSLFTNVMITGAIGSGKTSSAIYPMLEQLLDIYGADDEVASVNDPYQKLGGVVLDVKGDFYEALIYMMHEAGRNVLEDLVVITPYSNYPYIELVDPDNGNLFYISGRGGGDETSNELAGLLIGYSMPDPTTGIANPRQPIASTYLLDDMEMDRPLSATIPMTLRQYIEGIVFDVGYKQIRYLGWRDEGSRMRRVLHTAKTNPEVLVYATDGQGRPIYADKPQRLKFRAVRYINNGLTFNICPPSLAPTEMANRLVSMSKTASGKGGGDNAFWDDATKKHIGWVVQMWRTVNPKVEITAIDINRLTANQDVIDAEVGKLKKFIKEKETRRKASIDPAESKMLDDELPILKDMLSYFDGEWATLDMKTKSNLIACITNLFGQFMSETRLRSTFCVPSSFSMETVMSSGKIFTLVAPGYEGAAKVFGTALKMEFQALLKRRLAQANYNKMRLVLFMCDEAQNYVTAGGGDNSGDENFMALSRQSRVTNIIATQSDSSITNVIGDKSAPVYFQSFGCRIWYQNLDEKTNKSAAFVLGKVKKEKRSRQGQEFQMSSALTQHSQARGYQETLSTETNDRYAPEVFASLNVHEAVMFNKNKEGTREKSCRTKLVPHPIGSKTGQLKKNAVVRWYFQSFIENRMFAIGESSRLDHKGLVAATAVRTAPAPVTVPAAPAGPVAPAGLRRPPTAPGPVSPIDPLVSVSPPDPAGPVPPARPLDAEDIDLNDFAKGAAKPASTTPAAPAAAKPPSTPLESPFGIENGIADVSQLLAQPVEPAPGTGSKLPDMPEEDREIDKADLQRIQKSYGDSDAIGRRLRPFVDVIDHNAVLPDWETGNSNLETRATGAGLTNSSGGWYSAATPEPEKSASEAPEGSDAPVPPPPIQDVAPPKPPAAADASLESLLSDGPAAAPSSAPVTRDTTSDELDGMTVP